MTLDYEWWDNTYDEFTRICEIIGFDVSPSDIYFSGFWSQGDGASFTGSYRYAKQSARKIREYVPKDTELHAIADMLQELQKRNFYQLSASITRMSHYYVHENTIWCGEVERDSHGYRDPTEDSEETITDAARRLSQWLYSVLEKEYEWLSADESGRDARQAMIEARDAGKEYVKLRRNICEMWRLRHDLRDVIRDHIRLARDVWGEYRELRETALEKINEKPSKTWPEYEAWGQGYDNGAN